jgi:hypothetical protein
MQICLRRRSGAIIFTARLCRFTSGADRVGARVCISLSLSLAPEETLDSLGRKLIIRYLLSCVSRLSQYKKRAETQHAVYNSIPETEENNTALERVNYFLCASSVRQRNTQIYLFTMCAHTHTRTLAGRELWRLGQEEVE